MKRLEVLLVQERASSSAALSDLLVREGYSVACVATIGAALAGDCPDALVVDLDLVDGSGLDLLRALRERGGRPHTIVLADAPTLDDCRDALRAGAAEFLAKPFRIDELVGALERAPRRLPALTNEGPDFFERTYVAIPSRCLQAVRDVLALALRCGIAPGVRARIGGALHELVDNARRHGYAHARGAIHVAARLHGREWIVEVRDRGFGFDAERVASAASHTSIAGGLARARALADELELETLPGRGTRVTLRFAAWRVDFDHDTQLDLTELDWMSPELARRVLLALERNAASDTFHVSPALAVVVGRLLASARAGVR